MNSYNFKVLSEDDALVLLNLWLTNKHVEAKAMLMEKGVVKCASCLDNTSYRDWMTWWIASLNQ